MIASSRLGKGLALGLACCAHGALALAVLPDAPPVQIEGAGEAAETAVGSSFADMAAGTISAAQPDTPQTPETPQETALTPEAETDPVTPAEPTPTPPETPVADAMPPEQPEALTPQSAEATAPQMQAPESAIPAEIAETLPAETARALPPETAAAVPALTAEEPTVAERPEPQETIAATDDTPPGALASSLRPLQRPTTLDIPEPEPQPKAKPAPQKPTTQTARTQPKPKPTPAPQGNAERNARAGQESGRETARATTTGGGGKKRQSGNAAASNYPGQVMRKLSRVSRPRMNVRGATVISFQIAGNGGLAGVSVSRSSGSSALDSAAIKVIQRAAPFPAPPAGAQRSYSIKIQAR